MPKRIVSLMIDAHMTFRDWMNVILIAMALMFMTTYVEQYLRDTAPATEYFEVYQIGIPNFPEGYNPAIIYDRVVRKPFSGEFTAEIQGAGTLAVVCPSTKKFNYDPDKKLPKGGVTLSWLMYREPLPDCNPEPGSYRVNICWTIERYRTTPARYCANSNVFTVYPKNFEEHIYK